MMKQKFKYSIFLKGNLPKANMIPCFFRYREDLERSGRRIHPRALATDDISIYVIGLPHQDPLLLGRGAVVSVTPAVIDLFNQESIVH